jgi:hypothetical protein
MRKFPLFSLPLDIIVEHVMEHQFILEKIFIYLFHSEIIKLSWKSLHLTCQQWHLLASEIHRKIDVFHAFSKATRAPFFCEGQLFSSAVDICITTRGVLQFPPPTNEDKLQVFLSHSLSYSHCSHQEQIRFLVKLCTIDGYSFSPRVLGPLEFTTNFDPTVLNIDLGILISLLPSLPSLPSHSFFPASVNHFSNFFKDIQRTLASPWNKIVLKLANLSISCFYFLFIFI